MPQKKIRPQTTLKSSEELNALVLTATTKILLGHPFFACLLLKRPVSADTSIDTACTDGRQIWYSPQFFSGLSLAEIMGVLAHEVLHCALLHHLRDMGRDHDLWNRACDFVINLILVEAGFTLPAGVLLDDQFKGMSAEHVYHLLKKNGVGSYKGTIMIGQFKRRSFDSSPFAAGYAQEVAIEISRLRAEAGAALTQAKMRGRVPAGLERVLGALEKSLVNWKDVLAAFLHEQFKTSTSFLTPNRRYIHQGIYLPGQRNEKCGSFIFAFDTSMSISEKMLNTFFNEAVDILQMANEPVTVIHCDAAVERVETLYPGDPRPTLHPKGGGGTSFSPVFEYANKNKLDVSALIYFTDGECSTFGDEPVFPVLWGCTDPSFSPPFGQVVALPIQQEHHCTIAA